MTKTEVLILKRGDELISKITDFCEKKNINSAWFSGLGAAESANLAIYDLDKKEYQKKRVPGPLEITNISGNIAKLGKKLIIHCHTTLSDTKMKAYAGHVEEMIISGTGEIFFTLLDDKLIRKHDPETGLNLIEN